MKKRSLAIAMAFVAAFVLACLAACSNGNGGSGNAGGGSGTSVTVMNASDSASSEEAAGSDVAEGSGAVVESGGFRAGLSSEIAQAGTHWDASGETLFLKDRDGSVYASIVWGATATREDESKFEAYRLSAGGEGVATLRVYELDANGGHVYWGNTSTPTVLATDKLGVTVQDLIALVTYSKGETELSVELASSGAAASSSGNVSASKADSGPSRTDGTSAFWGVWIGASKSEGEAQAIADGAKSKGLPASVFYTTDWSNLNSEPWYVISVGTSATEAEADGLRDRAIDAGFEGAYVKYSGDPQ